MPMKTCPKCGATAGVRTLVCSSCKFEFRAAKVKNTDSKSPMIPPPSILPDASVGVTDCDYALPGETGRPMVIINLTESALKVFSGGQAVHATFKGQDVLFLAQVVEDKE